MSLVTFVSSVLGGITFLSAGLVVAVTVHRMHCASWRGSLAVVTVVMAWLCWALALGQLLGSVGLLRRIALLGGAVISAAAAIGLRRVVGRRHRGRTISPQASASTGAPVSSPSAAVGRWEHQALTLGTALLVSLVATIWTARTIIALRRGIIDPDSLGYHLPFSITFAHSGYADQHRLLIPGIPVQFFPANYELLSAMALALTRSMAFAAAKNLIFGGFVLV